MKPMQLRVLAALNTNRGQMTRKQIGAITGDKKGFAQLVGSHREPVKPNSLFGRGFVESNGPLNKLLHCITPKAKAAIKNW